MAKKKKPSKKYWKIKVLKFYDGDSGYAERVDIQKREKFGFRLANIDCPESAKLETKQIALKAKNFAESWTGKHSVSFITYKIRGDKGRILGDIVKNNKHLTVALRKAGLCK